MVTQAIIYNAARKKETRIKNETHEKMDAITKHAMFCDYVINFDLELGKFCLDRMAL